MLCINSLNAEMLMCSLAKFYFLQINKTKNKTITDIYCPPLKNKNTETPHLSDRLCVDVVHSHVLLLQHVGKGQDADVSGRQVSVISCFLGKVAH